MLKKSRGAQRRRLAALISSIENLEQRRLLSESTINYTSGTYTQNFDTLINTGSVASPPNPMDLSQSNFLVPGAPTGSMLGWNGAFPANGTFNAATQTTRFSADPGTGTGGSIFSYGVANATNRALGSIASATGAPEYGVELINSGSTPISAVTISYTGETFRIGDAATADQNTLYFGYEVGTSVSMGDLDSNYTPDTKLYYAPTLQSTGNELPSSTPPGTPLASLTQTITDTFAVNWGAGQTLILRWHDYNETGSDYGMGLDNFSFTKSAATPGVVSFTSASFAGSEPTNGAGNNANFVNLVIQRSSTLGTAIIDYTIPNTGTATEGSDYLPPAAVAGTSTNGTVSAGTVDGSGNITGTITFSGSEQTAVISIPIVDDSTPEATENFKMTLSVDPSDTSGVTVAAAPANSATGNIYDNDGTAPSGLLLNELDVNPPGDGTVGHSDGPNEYVEIINDGSSTVNLTNFYFLSIEGDVFSNAGAITYSYPYSGTLNPGQIAILEATSGGPTPAAGAVIFQDSQFNGTGGILQNGTNSFALVYSQSPLTAGTDLDTTVNASSTESGYPENGTLQLTGSQTLIDSVGWHDKSTGTSGDGTIYVGSGANPADLSIAAAIPGAATRIPGDTLANNGTQWYSGEIFSNTNDPTSLTYDASHVSSNFPAGGVLTPGGTNYYSTSTSGQFGLASSIAAVNEEDGSITFTVSRIAGSTDVVTVPWAFTPGTAQQNVDYDFPFFSSAGGGTSGGTGYSGTLTFLSGQTSATLKISIVDDSIPEPTEYFTVGLGTPVDNTNASNTPLLSPVSSTKVLIGDNDTKLLLNEILANAPFETGDTLGSDQYNEFVEISGTPGQVIPANTYFISVEGDSTATIGNITYAIDLGGTVVGSNGLIEIRSENAASLLPPPAPGTTVVNGDSVDSTDTPNGFNQTDGVLQNGTNSFLLMSSGETLVNDNATVTPGESDDVDADKDGTLDLSRLGAHLIDGVGWTDGGSGDIAYGTNLNSGGFKVTQNLGSGTASAEIAPAAAVRGVNTTDVPDFNSSDTASLTAASDWYYGSLLGQDSTAPATDDRLVFDPANSGQFNWVTQTPDPVDPHEHLTPGELNYNTTPFVELPTSGFAGGSTNPILNIDWSSNVFDPTVANRLSTSQMTLTNTDTSTVVSNGSYSLASETALQAFANGYVGTLNLPTSLAQGHYKLTIASGVTDDFTLQSTASYSINFTVLYGDANGDGKVNALDFNALASHYGSAGNYSQGDFDYNGVIGSNDFAILAANYNKTVPAPTLSSPAAVAEALPASASQSPLAMSSDPMSLFSNEPIAGSLLSDLL